MGPGFESLRVYRENRVVKNDDSILFFFFVFLQTVYGMASATAECLVGWFLPLRRALEYVGLVVG